MGGEKKQQQIGLDHKLLHLASRRNTLIALVNVDETRWIYLPQRPDTPDNPSADARPSTTHSINSVATGDSVAYSCTPEYP